MLSDPLDGEKYYNESRLCENITSGSKVSIDDITSTEYVIIDSLDKVKKIQNEVVTILGQSKSDEDLDFLLNWNQLADEDKNKKYSKFQCHEVNLFLYFKDPGYFNNVVAPFIANKMEKSFIDQWLLGHHDKIAHYKSVEHLDGLNALEKTLLVYSLRDTDKESAQQIANYIKMKAETNELSPDIWNRIFDTCTQPQLNS